MSFRKHNRAALGLAAALAALTFTQCNMGDDNNGGTAFRQINLIADTAKFPSKKIDTNLVNPWGLAVSSSGNFWVANNETGVSTIYDGNGEPKLSPVTIPGADSGEGKPTGAVLNNTASFNLPNGGGKATFLFAGEDGTVTGWNTGAHAAVVIDRSSSGAVYKGIAIATHNGADFLYLANFHGGTVEVFNTNFQMDSAHAFKDSTLPADFAPFNVVAVKNQLWVTYAKQLLPDKEEEQPGAGFGYVNIFNADGSLVRRFASQGQLNAPWGVAVTGGNFGPFNDAVFIGNFGDGAINAFDSGGRPLGKVQDVNGRTIILPGLWALYWLPEGGNFGEDRLYFTAAPDEEAHGIFGYFISF